MKMNQNKLSLPYLLCLAALLLGTASCKKYLDVTPDNTGTLDYAFRNRNEAENYLFTCYSVLQGFSNIANNAGFTTSSEIVYPNNLTTDYIDKTGFNLIRGTQNTSSPGLNYWDNGMFQALRRCNTMLENIDEPVDLQPAEKKRWIAEVKFLKAYYHYYMLRMYGPIPIIKSNLAINSTPEEVRVKRDPVDSVFNYVITLLDEAIPDLPVVIQNQASELGRITQLIALSVKAEVLTTAASPLFNGNPDYAGIKDKDGVALFSTSYDATKWQKATDACKAAITACESNGLKLYTFLPPATIAQLTDSLKEVLTLQNAVTERWENNPEMIWALNPTFSYQGMCVPRMTSKSVVNAFSNPGTFAVPISTQELFYTDNGVPINEDKTFDYTGRYTIRTGDEDHRYYVKSGYETVKAHFGREPRFYANLAFDGGIWFGNGVLNQDAAYYVQARGNSAPAGPKDRINLNVSGCWPKKLANYLSVYDDGFQQIDFRLPMIRLAGLYLLYAETLNEVNGPTAEVLSYVDKVRARAALPGVQQAWSTYSKNPNKFGTKDGMRQIIHQERRIELCFEGQSGWDLRRWKELQAVLSTPMQGWSIYEESAVNYYRPQTILTPIFGLKDYLWPIADYDLTVNANLVQNPYW